MTRQNHTKQWTIGIAIACGLLMACAPPVSYDLILRGGNIYDGSGGDPFIGDVAIDGDTIVALGDIGDATATIEIDVEGLAVAPGFVNMMSWANESLIEDGRSQSDIRQGVTLEIMGEGNSMGPLNDAMKAEMAERQSDIRYDIEWTSLAEYLEFLERRGISPNVASFIEPHQYSTGMIHVFVNGEQVLEDGEHTGATPGRFVRGPGWTEDGD